MVNQNPARAFIEVPRTGRRMRKPLHTFHIRCKPFQIQPFLIAPVLAGETMKNFLHQSRVVSKPISNPIIGWWCEYYYFYVKLRDMTQRTEFEKMLIDPSYSIAALKSSTQQAPWYFLSTATPTGSYVNWVNFCMERVVTQYFRDQDLDTGTWSSAFVVGGVPLAQITNTTMLDSAILASQYTRPDVNVDLNANATITASEVDQALRQWQLLRSNGLTEQSYEDYLRSFGVTGIADEETYEPELLRYVREWTYPTNTVEPTTGVPSTAVSWSIQERADKDRFFKEPGFVFGVTVTRPKVYLKNQSSAAVIRMQDTFSWLPQVLNDDPITSMQKIALSEEPYRSTTDMWVDIRDLLLYGDQFLNVDPATAASINGVSLPNRTSLEKRFPSSADIDALFPGATKEVWHDGATQFSILGTQQDYTATTIVPT